MQGPGCPSTRVRCQSDTHAHTHAPATRTLPYWQPPVLRSSSLCYMCLRVPRRRKPRVDMSEYRYHLYGLRIYLPTPYLFCDTTERNAKAASDVRPPDDDIRPLHRIRTLKRVRNLAELSTSRNFGNFGSFSEISSYNSENFSEY